MFFILIGSDLSIVNLNLFTSYNSIVSTRKRSRHKNEQLQLLGVFVDKTEYAQICVDNITGRAESVWSQCESESLLLVKVCGHAHI